MKNTFFLVLGLFALPILWGSRTVLPHTPLPPIAPSSVHFADSLQADRDQHTAALMEKFKDKAQEKAGTIYPNLKVQTLRDLPLERFLRAMNFGYSRGLGVSCDFCHNTADWTDASNRHLAVARDMAFWVESMNAKAKEYPNLANRRGVTVNCSTCHQGHEEPPRLPPPGGFRQGGPGATPPPAGNGKG